MLPFLREDPKSFGSFSEKVFFFFKLLFTYLRDKMSEREDEQREREETPLLSRDPDAGAQSQDPQIMT